MNHGIRMPPGSQESYEAYLKRQYAEAHRRTYGVPEKIHGRPRKEPEPEPDRVPVPAVVHVDSPKWKVIAVETCEKHSITLAEMLGPEHWPHMIEARREAWWRVKHELGWSSRAIARRFNRDDSTVRYGILRYADAQARPE